MRPLLQISISQNTGHKMANSVDLDEMAIYEQSHPDLHCLQKYLFWSARVEDLWELQTAKQKDAHSHIIICFDLLEQVIYGNCKLSSNKKHILTCQDLWVGMGSNLFVSLDHHICHVL